LRIVSGLWRGRKLAAGKDDRIRPTADRTREALFNILAHGGEYRTEHGPLPQGVTVLDAFAGTGALGLEALSRGAAHVTFLDQHAEAIRLIRQNLATLDAADRATLVQRDATLPGRAAQACRLALLDAPYRSGLAPTALAALTRQGWLAPDAIAIVELETKEDLAPVEGFEILDERRYGKAKLVFLRRIT